jgi:hypothetical protein
MVHISPKNGRGQMTQTRAGVNITRKEKDGRPRVRWMKGPCDGVSERALEKKTADGQRMMMYGNWKMSVTIN